MNKISTKNLSLLPNIDGLKNLCKSLSALDAINSPEWDFRYYSYQKDWDKNEEFFQMRDGSGNEMKALFSADGCVINGFNKDSQMSNWKEIVIKEDKSFLKRILGSNKKKTVLKQNINKGVVDSLPIEFHEFIFGEPVKSSGTTFCIWRKIKDNKWNLGQIEYPNDECLDGSSDLLHIFDRNSVTYKNWAEEYFDDIFENRTLDTNLVEFIYNHGLITNDIVKKINPNLKDFEQLKFDLNEIGYEHEIV